MTTAIRIRDIEIVATIKETGQQSIRSQDSRFVKR